MDNWHIVQLGLWQWPNVHCLQPTVHLQHARHLHSVVQTEVTELALTQVNITTLGGGWDKMSKISLALEHLTLTFVLSGPRRRNLHFGLRGWQRNTTLGGFSIPESGTTYNIAFYDSDGVLTSDDFLGKQFHPDRRWRHHGVKQHDRHFDFDRNGGG